MDCWTAGTVGLLDWIPRLLDCCIAGLLHCRTAGLELVLTVRISSLSDLTLEISFLSDLTLRISLLSDLTRMISLLSDLTLKITLLFDLTMISKHNQDFLIV